MSDETDALLKEIRNLCVLNFLEVQDLKRRLNAADISERKEGLHTYANAVTDWMEELDAKSRNLVKDYPHLLATSAKR